MRLTSGTVILVLYLSTAWAVEVPTPLAWMQKNVPWKTCPQDSVIANFNVSHPGPFGSVEQMELIQRIRSMTTHVSFILEKKGVCHWADSGTLLGIRRHSALIPYDEDADLGIMDEEYEEAFKALNSSLSSEYKLQTWSDESDSGLIRHMRVSTITGTHTWVDIYCYKHNERTKMVWHPWSLKARKADFFPLIRAPFYDTLMWIPRNTDRILSDEYGPNFMVPSKNFDWKTLSWMDANEVLPAEYPLVSLIIPTYERPYFLAKALEIVRRQDYPNLEVIIVDDSRQPLTPEFLSTIIKKDNDWIHYHHINERKSIGEKRNIACELATGKIVMQWDDDDFYREHRITHQVQPIIIGKADLTAVEHHFYLVLSSKKFYQVERLMNWGPHFGTITIRRSLWEATRYTDTSLAEDYGLAERAILSGGRLTVVDNQDGKHVYIRHQNTWEFDLENPSEEYSIQHIPKPEWFPEYDLAFFFGVPLNKPSDKPPNYFSDPNIRWDLPELQPPKQSVQYPSYFLAYPSYSLAYPSYFSAHLQYPSYGYSANHLSYSKFVPSYNARQVLQHSTRLQYPRYNTPIRKAVGFLEQLWNKVKETVSGVKDLLHSQSVMTLLSKVYHQLK